MNKLDTKKLEKLLTEKKLDEAKALLEDFFHKVELTPEEKGALYVNLAKIYLEVNNRINGQYLKMLDNMLEALKKVDQKGKEINDRIELAVVRSKIKGSNKKK